MDSRQDIERILDQAYAARQKQDIDAVVECFHPRRLLQDERVGERRPSDRVGQRAAWKACSRPSSCWTSKAIAASSIRRRRSCTGAASSGPGRPAQVADTDVLDLIEVRDGRIASLTSFFDTALAARIL